MILNFIKDNKQFQFSKLMSIRNFSSIDIKLNEKEINELINALELLKK